MGLLSSSQSVSQNLAPTELYTGEGHSDGRIVRPFHFEEKAISTVGGKGGDSFQLEGPPFL